MKLNAKDSEYDLVEVVEYESNNGRNKKGTPRIKWLEAVEKVLKEMEIGGWRRATMDK